MLSANHVVENTPQIFVVEMYLKILEKSDFSFCADIWLKFV